MSVQPISPISSSAATTSSPGCDAEFTQPTTPYSPKMFSVSQKTFTAYQMFGIRDTKKHQEHPGKQWTFKTIAGTHTIKRCIPQKGRNPKLAECIIDFALDCLEEHSRSNNLVLSFEGLNRHNIFEGFNRYNIKEIDDRIAHVLSDYFFQLGADWNLQQHPCSHGSTPPFESFYRLILPSLVRRGIKMSLEIDERRNLMITRSDAIEHDEVRLHTPSSSTGASSSVVYDHEYVYGEGACSNRRIEFWCKGGQITAKVKMKQRGSWQDLDELSEDQIAWKNKTVPEGIESDKEPMITSSLKFNDLPPLKKAELIYKLQEGKFRLVISHHSTSKSKWPLVRGVEFLEAEISPSLPAPLPKLGEYYYNCRSGYEPNRKLEFQELDGEIIIKRWAKIEDIWEVDDTVIKDSCIRIKGESASERLSRLKNNREGRRARQSTPPDIEFSTLPLDKKREYIRQLEPEGTFSLEIFSDSNTHLIDQINFIDQFLE